MPPNPPLCLSSPPSFLYHEFKRWLKGVCAKPPPQCLSYSWTLPQRHKLMARVIWFKPSPRQCCDFLWGVGLVEHSPRGAAVTSRATPGRCSCAEGKPGRPWFLFWVCRDPPLLAFSSVWLGGLWKAGVYFTEKFSSCCLFLCKYQKFRLCLTGSMLWSLDCLQMHSLIFFCPASVESGSCSEWFAAGNTIWVFHIKEIGMNWWERFANCVRGGDKAREVFAKNCLLWQ